MIMGSFDRIATVSAHEIMKTAVQMVRQRRQGAETVWQTVTVTSGRIIIGWRVGT